MSVFGAVATIKAFAREINSNEERDNLPLEEVQRVLKKEKRKQENSLDPLGKVVGAWKLSVGSYG